ncbi:family 10 glycosylhydrolase [Thermocoleostomius sinensis]|uniref:Family 10 glycosylhydrolase n=1 Tax=Thermocoleostomius sinensis A174 TaxID=2016057 RepID=A0A9E9C8Y1_9CYAN|nr:family 10 glycosylhydrolase [Thermocoleostomius sinensis]WAL58922.1 family 10 glycosylhydrolase [Thermocoleostomius sinensis A174]
MRYFRVDRIWQGPQRIAHRFVAMLMVSGLTVLSLSSVGQAQTYQVRANAFCQLSAEAIAQTDALRQAALQGDLNAQSQYKTFMSQQAEQMHQCRHQTWPQNQAIWLRLYPCDAQPGALEKVFDRIVAKGYNQVYLEVFHDGQVLLPASDNPTAWASKLRSRGYEDRDLLQEAIVKGHERGLKVYAWMFTLNFGYSYSLRPEQEQALARNGRGETSLAALSAGNTGAVNNNEIFVDPYSAQAKRDFQILLQAILARKPDGVLFDYIRYPLGQGADSVASRVQDLWIYGTASQQALFNRAMNQKGLALIERFVRNGRITAADVSTVNSRYPQETVPLWQGRANRAVSTEQLQEELWLLTVAHAVQGVLDFLTMAARPVQQQGIPAGAVFFPEANRLVGERGYDSRLQPWDRFPSSLEWHPMAYATCGDASCVVAQVQRVVSLAPSGTQIMPVLAGTWGQTISGHPPLEQQMYGLRQAFPQISTVSHFAYSWQESQHDRDRQTCQL